MHILGALCVSGYCRNALLACLAALITGRKRCSSRRFRSSFISQDMSEPRKVYVGNLSFKTAEEDFRAAFGKCGDIEEGESPKSVSEECRRSW